MTLSAHLIQQMPLWKTCLPNNVYFLLISYLDNSPPPPAEKMSPKGNFEQLLLEHTGF